MIALKLSVAGGELGRRMGERLGGSKITPVARVVWQRQDQRVVIHLDSLKFRFADGWLVCNLDLQTDQAGRQTLQFVFFLGNEREGNGTKGGATINALSIQAAQLADQWGTDVQRVLWDTVLDAIEAALHQAGMQKPNERLTLRGFHCTDDALHVKVLTGEF